MQIDLQPILVGPRLTLRPLVEPDWEALYQAGSDPLIWAVHPAHDRWQENVFRSYFEGGIASGGALVVVDETSGALIGSSRYAGYKPETASIEIGWTFLARSHWGGSYNRELKRLMLRHIFRFVATVTFEVGEDNARSRAAMEKIGGVLTDHVEGRMMAGIEIRHVTYAITKQRFYASALHLEAE